MRLAYSLPFVFAIAGCAYRTPEVHVPTAIPEDAFAGELHVDFLEDQRAPTYAGYDGDVSDVRAWVARMLPRSAKRSDARVTVRVDASVAWSAGNGWEACNALCFFPVLAGMDVSQETVEVDVVIESSGHVFHGVGHATKWGSLYAPAEKRALAVALDRALANAAAQ